MDSAKVSAVTDLPNPTNRKHFQRFLGFANFYRRFIRGYSAVAAPLTTLASSKTPFKWTEDAQGAFTRLKVLFTSAPILTILDPSRRFNVKVEASDVGVGAVLSQRSSVDNKLHPCAFFHDGCPLLNATTAVAIVSS